MALTAGARLGPYEIIAPLGAGGMGEVYRARDTRLERAVAIKVLAPHVIADPHFRSRFEREARVIAALEHPHICPLYDVGEEDGTSFLVMPHLHGETLADVLRRGPLPVDRALQYGAEIASALHVAHRAGVVHRDVKPGNVMVTKDGIKLLDFGLARLASETATSGATSQATIAAALTERNSVLGTLQYMAPEQIEGKLADARTDIFALGAVLHEMFTGRKAFTGSSDASLIAAILLADPPMISTMRTDASAALDRVAKKCLAKDPDERWQHAGDLATQLQWLNEGDDPTAVPTAGSRRLGVWPVAVLSAVIAATAAWMLKPSPAPLPAQRMQFTIELPPRTQLPPTGTVLALSPDGQHLVYTGIVDGETRLFAHDLAEGHSRPLDGTTGASNPFFSPDGQWVGFASRTGLQAVPIRGGTRLNLGHLSTDVGAAWGRNDQILLARTNRSPLSVGTLEAGPSRPITSLNLQRGETSHRHPDLLPGDDAVVFTAGPPSVGPWHNADIVAQSLETGERTTVIRGAAQARFSSGHLVYARAGTLAAVPFDPHTLSVTGAAFKVVEGVREDPSQGSSQFALSANGTLAYVSGTVLSNEVVAVDRRGRATPLMRDTEHRLYYQPRLSPDARQLAITVAGGNDDIWVYHLETEVLSRFTAGANYLFPSWTPDGGRLAFYQSDTQELLWQRADRTTSPEILLAADGVVPHSWSPDGRLLALTEPGDGTGSDVWLLRVNDRQKRPLIASRFGEVAPMISPDGRWLAYTSDESGRYEVYVVPFPDGGARVQVSREGGTEPQWSKDGRELFYRQDEKLMAVGTRPQLGKPAEVFEAPWWTTRFSSRTNYDVFPGGQRFVLLRSNASTDNPRIHVIVNWVADLK